MFVVTPMLACRGPVLTNGEAALLLSVLAGWLIAAILSIVNGYFILMIPQKASKFFHGFIFALYIGSAVLLYNLAFSNIQSHKAQDACIVLVFAIPISAIAHFVCLIISRRGQKHDSAKDA